VKNQPTIDLVLCLLSVETVELGSETEDFRTDVTGQVFGGEDRWGRIGNRDDRNDVEVASAGMKLAPAAPAEWAGALGVACVGRIARHV
jgi:hypothetical protein